MYKIIESPDKQYDIYILSVPEIIHKKYSWNPSVIHEEKVKNIHVNFKMRNNEICYEGNKLFEIIINKREGEVCIEIEANAKGLLLVDKKYSNSYNEETNQFSFFQISNGDEILRVKKNISSLELNVPFIDEDKFNKIYTLKWLKVGGNYFNHFEDKLKGFFLTITDTKQFLFFTINNLNGRDYIVINHRAKDYDIKANDKFLILLENDDIITLSFDNNSYNVYDSSSELLGEKLKKIKENKAIITIKDLNLLAKHKIVNWRLAFQSGQELVGINPIPSRCVNNAYTNFSEFQELVLAMFQIYLSNVSKIKGYLPIEDYNELKPIGKKEECFLYLMIDTINGYHKIGISNKPDFREKTLQSEKPSIELIASKSFPNRKIAESIEKALHKTFLAKNIRGEWFNLSEEEIDDIVSTLK